MRNYEELANYIFSDITDTIEDLEKRYPERILKEGAEVTRFAPSPTGFLHMGSLFTSMIAKKLAADSHGIFYTRLEDTDTKREIEGSGEELISQLTFFGVTPDEGYFGNIEKGNYGPYKQSDREKIYRTVIKDLMIKGRAYPCFCTSEELDAIRKEQEANKEIPGYYGKYTRCRDIDPAIALERIKNGEHYVIRFRSEGNHLNKVVLHDEIRGDISIAENDIDIVILKSDGLPTYHFAHVCDDHFMRTTTVIRGEEWISSAPIHIELFNTLNFKLPKYAHLPVIMKLDNGNRRKLSKRKDPEASVAHFLEEGYPVEAIMTYLMSIANSNFEDWCSANNSYKYDEFKISLNKMSLDGVLFDGDKLAYYSKEIIAKFSAEDLYERVLVWSKTNDNHLYAHILDKKEYFTKVLNIERGGEKARKDYVCYKDIFPLVKFFFNEEYDLNVKDGFNFNEKFSNKDIKAILGDFVESYDYSLPCETWFNKVKEICERHNFAVNNKDYKANPSAYKGNTADVAEIIRIALTGSKNSPNLFYVINILGKEEVSRRIQKVFEYCA